jgi:hypothetical protein
MSSEISDDICRTARRFPLDPALRRSISFWDKIPAGLVMQGIRSFEEY